MTANDKADLLDHAESDRARAIEAAANNEYMSAAFHTAAALKKYQRLNNSERIQELKALLVEYNSKAPPLSSHKVSVPITEEMAEEFDKLIIFHTDKETLKENLFTIAKSGVLLPRIDEAKKNAQEIRPMTAQLVTHMLLDSDGHTKSYDDFETTWLHQNYDIQLNLTHSILDTSISRLVMSGQFKRDAIIDIFINKGIFSTDHLLKLDAALERRFEDDYFSAIHILTPLIETTFMALSRMLGLDTITLGRNKVSTTSKTLSSEILSSIEYHEVWGEDFCYMLDFFMYEQTSHRFRHKIAHGDIKMNECNFTSFNLLFYFLIKMTMMIKVEIKETS